MERVDLKVESKRFDATIFEAINDGLVVMVQQPLI